MKKIFILATAALLVTGTSFAQDKKCSKGCCKKGNTVSKEKAAEKKSKTAKV